MHKYNKNLVIQIQVLIIYFVNKSYFRVDTGEGEW